MNKPLKTFLSYSREDRTAKRKLGKCLKGMEREELIKIWADNEIIVGDKWREEILTRTFLIQICYSTSSPLQVLIL